MPAAFRVTVPLDREGTWRFRAEWSGRGIGSLRIAERGGQVIGRVAGASPLELVIPVSTGAGPRAVVVHFSTLGARGELHGILAAIPPPSPPVEGGGDADGLPERGAPAPVAKGPGACLLAGSAARDTGRVGRRLRELAEALSGAAPEANEWARRWVGRGLAASMAVERRGREEFDELWEALRLDPCPDPGVGRAVRGVLALLEDLARREEARRGAGRGEAAADRRALAAALRCLAPVDPSR